MDDAERQAELESVFQRGEANLEVIRLAKNFCRHLEVERARFSGVGIPEQMTGLPISPREFFCQYAGRSNTVIYDACAAALSFYDQNCTSCERREPVGLPNLLSLVEDREKERRERRDSERRAQELADVQLAQRSTKRETLAQECTEVQKGIIRLIGEVDKTPEGDAGERLVETAKATPDAFQPEIRDLLLELIQVGGPSRVDPALGALAAVEGDPTVLARACAEALAHRGSLRPATQLFGKHLALADPEQVEQCLPSIAHLASPEAHPFPYSGGELPPDPEPLMAALQHHRQAVVDWIVRALRAGSPWKRRDAAYCAGVLIRADQGLCDDLVPDLARSVLLPDDRDAHPRNVAEEAIGQALRISPVVVDAALRGLGRSGSTGERALLFGAVERFFRFIRPGEYEEAAAVAFQHVVEALNTPDEPDRLGEAARVLERVASSHPEIVAASAIQLLGAAAILAERLDEKAPNTAVETLVPPELKALEEMNRRQTLQFTVDKVVSTLCGLGPRHPQVVGSAILELLHSLSSEHDRLLGSLIRGVGEMGAQSSGLSMALPSLYLGMMSQSSLVRASEVSSKVVERG